MNVGVLVSGSGTNLQALIERHQRGDLGPAQLVVIGCNVPECQALARAKQAALPTFVVDHRDYPERPAFDQALVAALRSHQVDLVVLAGFNRLLGRDAQVVSGIREDDDRGRHTTTSRRLIPLPGGGLLLDTPGMREFQLWVEPGESGEGIGQAFPELDELAVDCRFRDCQHKEEPGCAVQLAIAEGQNPIPS